MQLGITLGLANMPTRTDFAPLNLVAPALGDAPIGSPVSVDLRIDKLQ